MSWGPVLVTARSRSGPEPEVEQAGVTQTDPHVRGGGVLRDRSHLLLNVPGGDVDEVHVVLPAVTQGLHPGQVLLDQYEVLFKTREILVNFKRTFVANEEKKKASHQSARNRLLVEKVAALLSRQRSANGSAHRWRSA